jgi:hypothetical protein
MLPTEVEEFLCFNADADYSRIKLLSAFFDTEKDTLTANYIYTDDIEDKLPALKPELEKLFIEAVSLPINIEFVYTKSYIDEMVLRLKITEFLHNKFTAMAGAFEDANVKAELVDNTFTVNLYLSSQFANFLEYSNSWRSFKQKLADENFYEFDFFVNVVPDTECPAEPEEVYVPKPEAPVARVDKVYRIKDLSYLFGRPIKERPIKIEFLYPSPDEQVIAGEIEKLTKREYTRKTGEKKPYFTFTLNDGDDSAPCVFFPNKSNLAHFEKLSDGDFVAVIGVFADRNGRRSFNVSGAASCAPD